MPRDRVPNTRRKRPPLYDARHGHHSTPENRRQPDYRVTSPILAEAYRVIVARSTRSAPSFVEIGETSIFDRAGYSAFLSDSMALSPWMAHMVCRWAFPIRHVGPKSSAKEGRSGARCHASVFMCRRLPCGHPRTHYCCCRRILKPLPISNPGFPGWIAISHSLDADSGIRINTLRRYWSSVMACPLGDAKLEPLRVDFDRRFELEFHGSDISSDAGLLP